MTYGYGITSKRIASITQSDGSSGALTYKLIDGEYGVETYTDAEARKTTFAYTSATSGGTSTSAPANQAVLSTTDTVSYPQVSGALTVPPASWSGASLRENLANSANDPRIAFD